MAKAKSKDKPAYPELDAALGELVAAGDDWAQTGNGERVAILTKIKDDLMRVSDVWVTEAARQKMIPKNSSLVGEEWLSGPYAVMSACNGLIETLTNMTGKTYLDRLPKRDLPNGQLAVKVVPHNIWDRLLLSGVSAEVWMQKSVTRDTLGQHAAGAYDTPPENRKGKVALILGAGNISSITPLDCFQKLFQENQVVILKMNPVNEYLIDFFAVALKSLIDRNALRIVKGGVDVGAYLCNHPDVAEIHITGAATSHDAIVWGKGAAEIKNKKAGTPINDRPMTSELGGVGPVIVVPGPWTDADISFQAEQIATQKLHNSGFNCIACQMMILPSDWDKSDVLVDRIEKVMNSAPGRGLYYPGAEKRLQDFAAHSKNVVRFERPESEACLIVANKDDPDGWFEANEVFAPALSIHKIAGTDAAAYLRAAIKYSNDALYGTLGANILIHPATKRAIGKKKFDEILLELKYGTIAVNAWTGLGFLLAQVPWGAFPGHTLDNVQSGIGIVHNSYMFDRSERTVVAAPFRPFPRNLLSGGITLLPRPPWFITNKKQRQIGKLLTEFQHKPSWLKIPAIFFFALLG